MFFVCLFVGWLVSFFYFCWFFYSIGGRIVYLQQNTRGCFLINNSTNIFKGVYLHEMWCLRREWISLLLFGTEMGVCDKLLTSILDFRLYWFHCLSLSLSLHTGSNNPHTYIYACTHQHTKRKTMYMFSCISCFCASDKSSSIRIYIYIYIYVQRAYWYVKRSV